MDCKQTCLTIYSALSTSRISPEGILLIGIALYHSYIVSALMIIPIIPRNYTFSPMTHDKNIHKPLRRISTPTLLPQSMQHRFPTLQLAPHLHSSFSGFPISNTNIPLVPGSSPRLILSPRAYIYYQWRVRAKFYEPRARDLHRTATYTAFPRAGFSSRPRRQAQASGVFISHARGTPMRFLGLSPDAVCALGCRCI